MMHSFNNVLFNVELFNIVFYCCTNNAQLMTDAPQLTFTCSNSTIETLRKGVKYIQSWQ